MHTRFAIVGCGYIAHRHLKHIIDHPYAEVVGIFDNKPEQLYSFAKQYQVEAFMSYESLLTTKDLDLVVICTPNGTHAELAVQALKAGIHVLVEKPMATSTNDALKMVAAAKEHNKHLYIVKQNRYNPPVQAVKQLIDDEKLGKVNMVTLNCFWNRNETYYMNSDWKGTKELDGGVLYTQFSHFIDILYYLFGEIENVAGRMKNLGHKDLTEIEDSGSFNFEFCNGGLGSINFTTCAYQQNMEGSITIFSENCTLKIGGKYLNTIDYQQTAGFDIKHLPASSPANNYGFYQGSMSNHDKVIDNVVRALHGKEPIMTSDKDGLAVIKMIDQFYKASV